MWFDNLIPTAVTYIVSVSQPWNHDFSSDCCDLESGL